MHMRQSGAIVQEFVELIQSLEPVYRAKQDGTAKDKYLDVGEKAAEYTAARYAEYPQRTWDASMQMAYGELKDAVAHLHFSHDISWDVKFWAITTLDARLKRCPKNMLELLAKMVKTEQPQSGATMPRVIPNYIRKTNPKISWGEVNIRKIIARVCMWEPIETDSRGNFVNHADALDTPKKLKQAIDELEEKLRKDQTPR
jgi:hypothetical protein